MTSRIETDQHGEPVLIWIDGTKYTLDELRDHLARSAALDTVIRWHADAEYRYRQQRRIVRILERVIRRLTADLPTHTAFLQAQHTRRLNADPDAPWQHREQGQYAQERAHRTKER